jgi:putative SOS response-associated peptidase YedK
MCGRFAFHSPRETLAQLFALGDRVPELPARWNIAPGTDVPVVRVASDGARELVSLRWGLVPSWSKDRSIGQRLVNARAETLSEKPAFRTAFRRRRCLVPADGYYEWRVVTGGKQPYFVHAASGRAFAMAGLWEHWVDPADGKQVDTCVIVTREAAGLVSEIHTRMPVIVPESAYAAWLDPTSDPAALLAELVTGEPALRLDAYAVSRRVNSPRNEGAELVEPAAAERL